MKIPIRALRLDWRSLILILTPIVSLPLIIFASGSAGRCAYVVVLMAVYWMLELLPLSITALIPIIAFPILGIMGTSPTSMLYLKGTNMLFIGGLMVAIAVEHSGLHRRIALSMMLLVGTSPRLLMLGFMFPTAFLSMWISNTATTAMMVPIIEAVLAELNTSGKPDKNRSNMMMLAVGFSANIGGTGTLVGTGPNLVMYEFISRFDGQPISFGSWMMFAVPGLLVNLLILWLWLQLVFLGIPFISKTEESNRTGVKRLLETKYKELGKTSFHEMAVLVLFLILVVLWFFRSPGFITGWGDLIRQLFCEVGDTSNCKVDDATPAILISLLMFAIPAVPKFLRNNQLDIQSHQSSETLVTWNTVEKRLPWGVILLIGGGFALAEGSERSCLNAWIGSQLARLAGLDNLLLLLIVQVLGSVLTQVASNTATAAMLLPVLLKFSQGLKLNPLYLVLSTTLTASHAFVLPVSTAPNAIVFAASGMSILDMVKAGFVMNILTIITTIGAISTYGVTMFGMNTYPDWALNSTDAAIGGRCDNMGSLLTF